MAEVAVVAKDSYPVRWVGRQAVVTLPEHIDVSNAGQILDELLSVISRGTATLIADMTATLSCDHAGADAVVRACQRALADGTQLRLVVTRPHRQARAQPQRARSPDHDLPSLEAATAAAKTAVPSENPVTEGVRSFEVRWIFSGQLETAVVGWFERFPAGMESREGIYLLDPHLRGVFGESPLRQLT
jgi:anti-anti-sigma regulatory factor